MVLTYRLKSGGDTLANLGFFFFLGGVENLSRDGMQEQWYEVFRVQAFQGYTRMCAALQEVVAVLTSPAEQHRRSQARGHPFGIDFASEQKEAAFGTHL